MMIEEVLGTRLRWPVKIVDALDKRWNLPFNAVESKVVLRKFHRKGPIDAGREINRVGGLQLRWIGKSRTGEQLVCVLMVFCRHARFEHIHSIHKLFSNAQSSA